MNESRLTSKKWLIIVLFGLIGQVAWTIENMYLNVYIYKTVTYDPKAIAYMVSISGVIATFSTLTMGALSDKIGKRKVFMSYGYLFWGLSIVLFALITKDNVSRLFPNVDVVFLTVFLIIVLDCLMTFIGSSANDAAFNAWVTDNTTSSNRAKVEGVLSSMPLFGMLLVFGGFDGFTKNGQWFLFFLSVGVLVFLVGFLGLFMIKDAPLEKKESSYLKDLFHGFRITTIKENKPMYLIFVVVSILGIAQQIFLPYFIIYFEFYMGFGNYVILLGAVLILASILSISFGRKVDKSGKKGYLTLSVAIYVLSMFALGFLGFYYQKNDGISFLLTLIFGVLMMGFYLGAMVVLNSLYRDLVPKAYVGVFSGIRMIFFILIPMVIGPFIGAFVISQGKGTFIDEFGVLQSIPNPGIFIAGAIVGLLSFYPIHYVNQAIKNHQ